MLIVSTRKQLDNTAFERFSNAHSRVPYARIDCTGSVGRSINQPDRVVRTSRAWTFQPSQGSGVSSGLFPMERP